MPSGLLPLTLEQGSDEPIVLRWRYNGELIDPTEYTFELMVRPTANSEDILATASSANGKITTSSVTNNITITFTSVESLAWTFQTGVYDLFAIKDSLRTKLIKGPFILERAVTHD